MKFVNKIGYILVIVTLSIFSLISFAVADMPESKKPVAEEEKDSWKEFYISPLGMSMSFPKEYFVYTRDMKDTDPALAVVGISGSEVAEILANSNIYIDALDLENNEIVVAMKVGAYSDFASMSDDSLLSLATLHPSVSEEHAKDSAEIMPISIFRNNELAYIVQTRSIIDSNGELITYTEYDTAVNGQTISFVYYHGDAAAVSLGIKRMQSIMDRVTIAKTRVGINPSTRLYDSTETIKENDPKNFEYVFLENQTISIVKYTGHSRDIIIPSMIDGHRVEVIDDVVNSNKSIRSVEIQDGVKYLKGGTFANCPNLKEVSIPNSVLSMESYAFSGCESLVSVKLPDQLPEIYENMFYKCTSLSEIDLPSGIIRIGYGAFERCSSLLNITIPLGVKQIDQNAFRYCVSLTSVVVPEGVETIGSYAFIRCNELKSIILPATLKEIGKEAFNYCPNLIATVNKDSYAEYYCRDNNIPYVYNK